MEEASRKPATPFILNELSCCKVQGHQGSRSSIADTIDKSLFLQQFKSPTSTILQVQAAWFQMLQLCQVLTHKSHSDELLKALRSIHPSWIALSPKCHSS